MAAGWGIYAPILVNAISKIWCELYAKQCCVICCYRVCCYLVAKVSSFPGVSESHYAASKTPRYLANWRARYFLDDRKIQFATVAAIYKTGYSLQCGHCLPVGAVMNLEFLVRYKDHPTRIRIKGRVDYCLLKSTGDGAEVEVTTTKITPEHQHVVNNLIQLLSDSKEFNLRI